MTYLPSVSYSRPHTPLEHTVGYSAPTWVAAAPLPLYTLESRVEVYTMQSAPVQVVQTVISEPPAQQKSYQSPAVSASYFMPHKTEYFSPEPFLNPSRQRSQWIGATEEVMDLVTETFEKVTGDRLPHDLSISVVPSQQLHALHVELGGMAAPGLQGFSINRHGFGESTIFVKQNELDQLLLTIGHEIGHVLTFGLSNKLAEECKAFAFELAWMETIVEHNIGNLALSVNLNALLPAQNGLHDLAWQWVQRWKVQGMAGKEIFRQLSAHQLAPSGDVA